MQFFFTFNSIFLHFFILIFTPLFQKAAAKIGRDFSPPNLFDKSIPPICYNAVLTILSALKKIIE